jgi:bis(5'-nucleosidyl)-tetraphosphatase
MKPKKETALRELKEETGLTAEIQSGFADEFTYFFRDPKNHELIRKTVYFFLAETFDKNVTLSFEHIGYVWLPYEEALHQLTFPNAKDLLKKAYEFLKQQENI